MLLELQLALVHLAPDPALVHPRPWQTTCRSGLSSTPTELVLVFHPGGREILQAGVEHPARADIRAHVLPPEDENRARNAKDNAPHRIFPLLTQGWSSRRPLRGPRGGPPLQIAPLAPPRDPPAPGEDPAGVRYDLSLSNKRPRAQRPLKLTITPVAMMFFIVAHVPQVQRWRGGCAVACCAAKTPISAKPTRRPNTDRMDSAPVH